MQFGFGDGGGGSGGGGGVLGCKKGALWSM